uniref:Uncharacterized protein n=1 Tax=Solanum tuberosum TaxID=4113 RepID=M1A8R7_SOLTU
MCLTVIRERFEINLDEHYVKDSCEDILKNRSRQWRYKLKQLFENARSEEEARKIEVPELTRENWNRLCDMWINPEHKGKTNPEGVEPDKIEFYKHTHYTSEKGWSSLEAETHYDLVMVQNLILQDLHKGEQLEDSLKKARRTTELEDSLKKVKHEVVSAQLELQNRLNAVEIVVDNH